MKNNVKALVLAAAFGGILAGIAAPLQATDVASAQPVQVQAADARYAIQARLSTEADLNGMNVIATVTDDAVTLTGYVYSPQQRDEAVQIAQIYAGDRAVVDNISVGGNQIQ